MDYLDISYLKTKFKTNKLLSSILYIYNSYDENENNIITSIDKYCINKNLDTGLINKIKLAILHIYNSRLLQYNLPHMLDKQISKGIPAFHIIFGECVAQLVSIMLISESLDNILNITCSDTSIKDLINHFIEDALSSNIGLEYEVDKEYLEEDLDKFTIQLINFSKLIINKF